MQVKIKKLSTEAKSLERKTNGAVGYDVSSIEDIIILPGETKLIRTGISIELPDGVAALIFPRSSLVLKKHLDMPNSIGVIDSDYRGECFVPLRNLGTDNVEINKGERIAQFVFVNFLAPQIVESSELSDTNRGVGGFGSTGKF
jgi:dUTP pyrophosphatase